MRNMEFETEYLENSEMFMAFFGQDEYHSLLQDEEKVHQRNDNVLVEKFSDQNEVTSSQGIDSTFEDADSLFGNEWMTSKIDFAGLPEFYDNFNVVDENTAFQSPSILAALFSDKSNVEKIATPEPDIVEKSVSDECHPVSPEHCVPDLEATIEEDQFKAMLDSYLANAKLSAAVEDSPLDNPAENDDVFVVEETSAPVVSLKRKLSVSTPEGPKPKVKTPEQKQRKRLQNRNAATRYRSKKRSEQEVLNAKCLDLEKENLELQQKIKNKQQEVQYLKDLIIDVFCKKHTSI